MFPHLLLLLVFHQVVGSCILQQNSPYNASDVFLRDRIAVLDYARVKTYKTIHCCAQNVNRILWYFNKKESSTWQLFPWFAVNNLYNNQPELKDRNQTLAIKDVGWDNEGIYKCVALSNTQQKMAEHNTMMKVFSCVERIMPEAYPPKTQYSHTGESVTFTCIGDYGCTADAAKRVLWTDENWYDLDDKSIFPRYNVTTDERANFTVIESNFTISAVTEEDYRKNFTCFVLSSFHRGNKNFTVRVKKTNVQIKKETKPGVVASVAISVLVVLVVSLVVIVLFYPTLKLFVLSRIPSCLVDKGNKHYHALILHEDEDLGIAKEIKERLEKDSYSVEISGDAIPGQDIITSVQNYAEKSRSLIIIYPSSYNCNSRNNNFERLVDVQQYFPCNLITVVKGSSRIKETVERLEDRTLVKLVYPSRDMCISYKQYNFYSKLKLRMPRRNKKQPDAEFGNLLTGQRPSSAAVSDDMVDNEDRRNDIF